MPVRTAFSTKELPDAVADLKQQCGDCRPRVVIYFGSATHDPSELSQRMYECFPKACVVGCTTAGEMAGGRTLRGSVVAMFLDEDVVEEAASATIENLGVEVRVRDAFSKFERDLEVPLSTLDLEKYVGLMLMDGLCGAEERLVEKIGDGADVFFVGGSAGDDLKFERTYVSDSGRTYTDAAVLLLLRLKHGFEIVKTQSFRPVGKTLLASLVDGNRKVIEFNHKPALDAYAEALGVTAEEAPSHFLRHPLGLMVAGEPFVRSPRNAEGRGVVFYSRIREGTELEVLEATDIVAETRRAMEARAAAGAVRGIIDFQCILRTLQLREENRCGEYGEIFGDTPMIGFSTFGEAYLGHLNQTSTMLLFR